MLQEEETVNAYVRGALILAVGLLVLAASLGAQQGAKNLVFNGDFERGTDGWASSGDPRAVKQRISLDAGRDGGKCIRLDCTEFEGGTSWRHAMLCQVDKVKVQKGRLYTLSFWAKGKDVEDYVVNVALQDTQGWKKLGLSSSFVPTEKWERFEFQFIALRDCATKSRLQIWFNSTGTIWVDDVVMTEGKTPYGTGLERPAKPLRAEGRRNLVPNASFECGRDGWGSDIPYYISWATRLNRLFGDVVEGDAVHGRRYLKITLGPKTQPVMVFDYLRPLRHAVRAPLAANCGYIELDRGKTCVLSAYLKADKEDTPALLALCTFGGWTPSKKISVGTTWKRYAWRFKSPGRPGYVLVGPDLRGSDRTSCTLMIDAVQLEQADAPTAFTTRDPVEVALATQRPGNIFFDGERPRISFSAHNAAKEERTLSLRVTVTDYFDRVVGEKDVRLNLAGGETKDDSIEARLTKRGFYRVRATLDGKELPSGLRIAIVPKYARKDSIIGINHAYGWDHLVKAAVDAGILWDRDWSFKWEDIEPQKGKFTFAETDFQVNREIRLGHVVLGLVPFPSANWSSNAPASVNPKREPKNREREAYKPRDVDEFKKFVSRTVRHYRDRIRWWQVFNEPIYTSYALPKGSGHTPDDYVRLVKMFYETAKAADANCKILAGTGSFAVGSGSDLDKMLKLGLLQWCDALDLHTYPRWRPPETLERVLVRVNEMMDAAGGRKPLWLTEHGYYADDDFVVIPPTNQDFSRPLPNERVQAEYSVRFNLILLKHGVRKIFYHAGTSTGLNRDNIQGVFFRFDGEPRKIYAAVAAFNELFSPTVQFVKDVSRPGVFRALVFRDG
ncbi:MAG: hypothetical protein AMS16_05335, partial [Planctomycetes bacterium DG_58]